MWKYILSWTISFANIPSPHQGKVIHKDFGTRRQADSAVNYLKAESQIRHFKLTYHIDSVRAK